MKLPLSLVGRKAEGRKPLKLVPRFALLVLLLLGGISLAGVLIQQHAASANPATINNANSNPLSPIWYFADGEVGAGFQQYLTLNNPDPNNDCQVQVQYLTQGTNSNVRSIKPLLVKAVGVPHASRVTLSANADLNIPVQQRTGILISSIVSVLNSNANVRSHHIKSHTINTTPVCAGIVAERPMYFTYRGIQSGSDVMGATKLDTSFYFADVPTQAGSSSFVTSTLSILNPPGGNPSLVTATYYANDSQVGVQSIIVASGARGTLYPDRLAIPAHVTAAITATQPVLLERPSYMSHMAQGAAGVVSGAVSVVGTSVLSRDWLFAEGYTGNRTQENLVLGNPTSNNITATVTLDYQNGHTQQVSVPVTAYSQVILDVNQLNINPTGTCDVTPCVPTPSVSAEVTGNHNLVVERQMFFHYQLSNVATPQKSTNTVGWTDVVGQVAAVDQASFAEGYVNTNYNEWMVLQNPRDVSESVTLYLYNELGNTYSESLTLAAHSRTTVNVTTLVITSELAGLHDGAKAYELSMLVQGNSSGTIFVAERPMYFNTGSTGYQGGTDVIGYSGSTLNGPWGITTGADHNVWFTDYDGNHIGKVSSNGTITLYNQGLSANSEPNYITLGPDGNLWFTEYHGNRIGMITPAGVITEYSAGLTLNSGPEQITKGPDGNLWFTEYDGNRIGKITTTGVITEYSAGLHASSGPEGITKGPDDNLWFTEWDGNRIGMITPAGVITEYGIETSNSEPQGITTGPDGTLWFTEYNGNKIGRITITGTITEYSSGLTDNSWPAQITKGPNGELWFTESNTSMIGEIDPGDGDISENSANMLSGSYPWDITMDQYSDLWFTEYNANQIGVYYGGCGC
ncbi:MAG: hypothetical protein ABI465_07125 [Ktedonobacteraceae bacterium]